MKKITMLLAVVGLVASTSVLAVDFIYYSPYVYLNDGTKIYGDLNYLCMVVRKDKKDNDSLITLEGQFAGFKGRDGDKARHMRCRFKSLEKKTINGKVTWEPKPAGGGFSDTSSPWGPASCAGDNGFLHSKYWEYGCITTIPPKDIN